MSDQRFNTGNPIGSNSPLDRSDNTRNLDVAVNAEQLTWVDRFGRDRKSFEGMESEFDADQAERVAEFSAGQSSREQEFDADQSSREQRFRAFIASSGYQFAGDYAAGIEITQYNQIIRDENGEFWRVSGQVDLPYVTTGAGTPEGDALVPAGDAVLRQDLSNPDKGAAIVGWRRDKLRDSITSVAQMLNAQDVSIWEFAHLVTDRPDPADFETWDWHPALQAAIDSQSYAGPGAYRGGPAVKLTPGKFKCSQTLIFSTAAKLYGHHSGMPYSQTSEIAFPENVLGIAINDRASRGVTAISPTGTSADGAWLEGMKISGGGGTSANAHGVLCRVRAVLNNLWVTGFAANGVRVSSTYPGTANSNANNGIIIGGRYELNGLHGLYFTGSDANIWGVSGLDCSLNGCSGIFDSSFLGCTFTACHTGNNGRRSMCHYDGGRYAVLSDTLGGSTVPGTNPAVWELINTGGPAGAFEEWESGREYLIGASYRSDAAAAKSAFIGCYAEGSQPLSSIGQSSIVVGGVLGSSPFSSTSSGSVVSSYFGRLAATNGFESRTKTGDLSFSMGEFEGAAKTLIKITDTALAPSSYRLRFLNEDIVFNYANGAGYASSIAFWLTTNATTRTFGRAAPVPHALVSNRLFVGNANASRNITCVGALPVSGEYARGDILFHSNLSAGGKAGWVCTTTGVAGSTAVFKQFGAIDA